MISIESPPSDPSSCSCSDRIPQLKDSSCSSNSCSKSSCSDEKKTSAANSASDNKLAFVEEEEVDPLKSGLDESNPKPKFSIRDYVFRSRSKDILKNWPFSQENLQLCLKHGVKNLLPPFHPLDSLRNPSFGGCAIDEIVSSRDGESSKQSDQIVSATADSAKCNPELALDFQSSNNNNCLELVADSLVEGSKQRSDLEIPPTSRKSDSTIQTTGKKGKLVVNFGPVVDPVSTNEDISVHNFVVSETMSSKVCPVCKTFSSSSNTTLNAHIDQCLSGESTMKWTANPKVIKNRIKPRKTRLMVDIYKTAPYCTLEELDRRNGTNWATNSSFPAQEIEFHGELKEKEQRLNKEYVETGHEGDVYIDTDGTKVRILSAPMIGVEGDDGARKLLKGKGSTNPTSKKRKKSHEVKHHKFLKLSPHRKKFCSPKFLHGFEMQINQEKKFSNEEDCENVDEQKHFQAQVDRELDDAGTIKSWGCSRRSSHAKRADGKGSTRFTDARFSPVENDQSSLERRCVLRTPSSSCSPISSPESSKRMDTSPYEPRIDEYMKHPLLRKRMAFQCDSSARNKAGSSTNIDGFVSSSKSRRFSSLKKNLLSASRESMSNLKRKFSALKKTQKHMEGSQFDRLHKPLHDSSRHQSVMEDVSGKSPLGTLNVLKLKKKRGGINSFKNEEAIALKSVQLQARKNLDSSRRFRTTMADTLGDGDSSVKEIEAHGERLATVGGNFSNPALDSESESEQFVGVHQGSFSEAEEPLLSPEPSLNDKDEMFYEDHIRKNIIGQDIGINAESDSKELGLGGYFAEVDPIPIPGPPGSFLPSPGGDMVSEDLQGNSSLTNSRVQSSDDHLDLVDRDSLSDSPISATSNISNPTLTRSDSRSSEKFSVRSAAVEEKFSTVQQATNLVAERTSNVNDWRVNEIFPEKVLPPSSKNDQPCCCSRKEGPPQTVASAYHESALLRRRAMESNKRPTSNLNHFKSEVFSAGNHPSSVPEKVVLPEVKFPVRNDCAAASPSSSNPVLRLMGKDLMVVKKDEAVSPQLRPPLSSAMVDDPNRQFQMVKAASSGDLPCEDYHSLRQVFPMFGPGHNEPELQHIDFSRQLPNDFSNHVQLKAPQTPIHASFPSTTTLAGGYMTSVDCYSLGGSNPNPAPQGRPRDYNVNGSEKNVGCRLPTDQQTRSNSGYGTPLACGRNVFSISNNPTKEIIIIDDCPENETDLPRNDVMQYEGIMRSNPVSSPIPNHFHSGYSPRHVSSFYDYQLRGSFPYGGLPVFKDARFQNPVSREMNSRPAQWSPNSVAASLPSAVRPSSTTYYPPSFS